MNPAGHLCNQGNLFDLVDYLYFLGYQPAKNLARSYWYLSPLRNGKKASFKVDRKINAWYDHGMGKSGKLVDMGILYFRNSVNEFLSKPQGENDHFFSFHKPSLNNPTGEKKGSDSFSEVLILEQQKISNPAFRMYLHQRHIPEAIASQFCGQVSYELYGKKPLAIGFKNDNVRYELRSQFFRGSSAPKDPSFLFKRDAKTLAVFEEFFGFGSFQRLLQTKKLANYSLPNLQLHLILNFLSFFEGSRIKMKAFEQVHLYFDCDTIGLLSTIKALEWACCFMDGSQSQTARKDLREYLMKSSRLVITRSQNRRMNF